MEYYIEKRNPKEDLGGLCECFISRDIDAHSVARYHVHQYFELLYCLKGSYELTTGQHNYVLRKGDIALIHPMEPHQTRSLDQGMNSYLVLKFIPETLYSVGQPVYEAKYIFPYLHFNTRRTYVYTAEQLDKSGLDALLMAIYEERQQAAYGYEIALRAYISQVFLWFLRAWNQNRDTSMDEKTLLRLKKSLEYIEAHFLEDLKMGDVAQIMGMGASTFSRFFAQAAGMSFPAFIRIKRLGRAAMLLSETDLSVTDIAFETGFSSASYLILCFREQYGMTPSQFRRTC